MQAYQPLHNQHSSRCGGHCFFLTMILVLLATSNIVVSADCSSPETQMEMNTCATENFKSADEELNQTYQALLKKSATDPAFIQKLLEAQRAWIKFRDLELEAMYACKEENARLCWGSMMPLCYLGYKTKMTRERTDRLKQYLSPGRPADGCYQ